MREGRGTSPCGGGESEEARFSGPLMKPLSYAPFLGHSPLRSLAVCLCKGGCRASKGGPNPQVAMALSALKPVVVQVKPILTFHPSGAAENVQNRFPTHVKNFACGLGGGLRGCFGPEGDRPLALSLICPAPALSIRLGACVFLRCPPPCILTLSVGSPSPNASSRTGRASSSSSRQRTGARASTSSISSTRGWSSATGRM